MALIKAQCTNCSGILDVDESKDAAICPFCNTPYIVEKAVNLFKTETHNHIVNNISYSGEGMHPEARLKNAYTLIEKKENKLATEILDECKKLFPTDWRVWFGYYMLSEQSWNSTQDTMAINTASKFNDDPRLKELGDVILGWYIADAEHKRLMLEDKNNLVLMPNRDDFKTNSGDLTIYVLYLMELVVIIFSLMLIVTQTEVFIGGIAILVCVIAFAGTIQWSIWKKKLQKKIDDQNFQKAYDERESQLKEMQKKYETNLMNTSKQRELYNSRRNELTKELFNEIINSLTV